MYVKKHEANMGCKTRKPGIKVKDSCTAAYSNSAGEIHIEQRHRVLRSVSNSEASHGHDPTLLHHGKASYDTLFGNVAGGMLRLSIRTNAVSQKMQ